MEKALESDLQNAGQFATCDLCGRSSGKGWSFAFSKPFPDGGPDETTISKCTRCALRHRPMLRRSLITAIVVGTVLTILNQGDFLFAGTWNGAMYWKIPLTYCVPFLVATYGALSNSRH